jgi:hypothetical protein
MTTLLVLAALVIAMLGTALLSAVISLVFGLGSDKLDFLLPVCFLAALGRRGLRLSALSAMAVFQRPY